MPSPVKSNSSSSTPTNVTNSPIEKVPGAPKKEARGSFASHGVSGVRRSLIEDFGTEPKRVKLTIEWGITVLRSKDIPNASFGQYWLEK